MFLALDHLAERTEEEFGVVVDRIWRQEPELSGEMRALTERAKRVPGSSASRRRKQR
jgi:hypothetical protein